MNRCHGTALVLGVVCTPLVAAFTVPFSLVPIGYMEHVLPVKLIFPLAFCLLTAAMFFAQTISIGFFWTIQRMGERVLSPGTTAD
jgi:hypothetical protein